MHLDPDDVEAIAPRFVELLDRPSERRRATRLATANEMAVALGVTRTWVYPNQERLRVIRLGKGPRARLRFDVERAAEALIGVSASEPPRPAHRRKKPVRARL